MMKIKWLWFSVLFLCFLSCGKEVETPSVLTPEGLDASTLQPYFTETPPEGAEAKVKSTISLERVFSSVNQSVDYGELYEAQQVFTSVHHVCAGGIYQAQPLAVEGLIQPIKVEPNEAVLLFKPAGVNSEWTPPVTVVTGPYPTVEIMDGFQKMLSAVEWSKTAQITSVLFVKETLTSSSAEERKASLGFGFDGLTASYGGDETEVLAKVANRFSVIIKRHYGTCEVYYKNPIKVAKDQSVVFQPLIAQDMEVVSYLKIDVESHEDFELTMAKVNKGLGLTTPGFQIKDEDRVELETSVSKGTITMRIVQGGPSLTTLDVGQIIQHFLSTHRPVFGSSLITQIDGKAGWICVNGYTRAKRTGAGVNVELANVNTRFIRPNGNPKELFADFAVTVRFPAGFFTNPEVVNYVAQAYRLYVWLGGGNGREVDGYTAIFPSEIQVDAEAGIARITICRPVGRWEVYSYAGSTGEKSKMYGEVYFWTPSVRFFAGGDDYYDPGYRWRSGYIY